jgi:hypothetical protein
VANDQLMDGRPTYRFHSLATYSYRDHLVRETRCNLNIAPIDAFDELPVIMVEMSRDDLTRLISAAQQALGKINP